MNVITRVVDWLITDHEYAFFKGTGFALVMVSIALVLVISCCVSKKIRNLFF